MSVQLSTHEIDQENIRSLPVHVAVLNDDLEKLQQLIQSGAPQLNQKTYETALHVAARAPSLKCLQWLLENNINSPCDCDCNGSTPCHYAVVYGNKKALEMMLNHDSKNKQQISEMKEENGLTILGLATLQGDLSMVQWIVNNFPSLAYLKDKSGNLPIHLAAAAGALDIVKLFAKVYGREYAEQMGSERKFQPVYYAVDKGKIDVVKYLIDDVQVDPLAKAKGGMTTLHAAVTAHQISITKWLVEKLGQEKILEKSDDGATLLHLAAAEGLSDLLQFLIDNLPNKSDINVTDDLGSTPAHDAAEFGEGEALSILLKNGADISLLNKSGETPFDLAVQNNHSSLIAMMTDYHEKGVKSLNKYSGLAQGDNGKSKTSAPTRPVRTSKDEAEEITGLIQQTADIIIKRKEAHANRQQSLQRSTDDEYDESEDLEKELMKDRENGRVNRSKLNSSSIERIPHEISPEGNIYAKVNKVKKKQKSVEKEDQMSDVGSRISSHHHARSNSYANHNDSTSSVGTSVSHSKKLEQVYGSRMYGYYPPFAPFPHPYYKKGPRSTSGSSIGSGSNKHYASSLPPGYPAYPYMPAMVAQYYGYPFPVQPHPYHPQAKGINERIHMEAIQKSRGQHYVYPHGSYYHPLKSGSKKSSRPSSGQVRMHKSPVTKSKHTDRAIGFGPTGLHDDVGTEDIDEDHPAPPPITKGGRIDHNPTELTHANFIMMKADEEGNVPTQASEGTKLQRAKMPDKYDGRYDEYIEIDSEDERPLPEHISVSTLAESALALLMVPILGVKGVEKLRPEEEKLSPKTYDEIEAQRTSKQWSSQQDLAEKFNSSSKSNVQPSNINDWSEMLGLSLTTPKPSQVKDISGSIRARNFAIQELKPPSLHHSMVSLNNEEENDDDDIVSVVAGDNPQFLQAKQSYHKKEQQRFTKKKRDEKNSKRSSSKSKSDSKSKRKHKKSNEEIIDKKKTKKSKNMVVESSSKEAMKEAFLKEVLVEDVKNSDVVTSVTVKVEEKNAKGPLIVSNTAIMDFSESDSESEMHKKDVGSSQGSINVEDIFAETEKEIEQMLADMPRSPTVQSVAMEDDNTETSVQEQQQLHQLQNMFPQTTNYGIDELASIIDAIKVKAEDLTPQQEIRLQLIQNVLAGKDPELLAKLLGLVSEGWSPMGDQMESASNTQLIADIENKLLESQEKQRRETEEHFRTQAERSETLQKRLEEQAARHMETIQLQLDQQKKMMTEQLEEQRKLLEQERNIKRSKHDILSSEDDSDDEVTMVHARPQSGVANKVKGRTNTMEAKIKHQLPLKWEDFSNQDDSVPTPPTTPTVGYLLEAVDDPLLKKRIGKRRSTTLEYDQTSRAFEKFTNVDIIVNDDDDDEEFMQAKAKVATRKRADIMKVQEKKSLETSTSGKAIKNILTVP